MQQQSLIFIWLALLPLIPAVGQEIPAAASSQPAAQRWAVDLRLRSEVAHEEGGDLGDASWTSLRAGLCWTGTPWQGLELALGVGVVKVLGAAQAWDGDRGDPSRLPIADPETRGLDRAGLHWSPLPEWRLVLGRQVLDDGDRGRWLGKDPWRQTPQVFDALSLSWRPDGGELLLVGLHALRRANGQRIEVTGLHLQGSLQRGPWRVQALAQAADFAQAEDGVDQWTVGLAARLAAPSTDHEDLRLGAAVEAALQQGWREAPRYRTFYLDLRLWASWRGWRLLGGHEWLAAQDRQYPFRTPFASHASQMGWAVTDSVAVPERGLRDLHVGLSWQAPSEQGLLAEAAFHDYFDHSGDLWQGKELNLGLGWRDGSWQTGLRYAYAISPFWRPDRHRGWMWLAAAF